MLEKKWAKILRDFQIQALANQQVIVRTLLEQETAAVIIWTTQGCDAKPSLSTKAQL